MEALKDKDTNKVSHSPQTKIALPRDGMDSVHHENIWPRPASLWVLSTAHHS